MPQKVGNAESESKLAACRKKLIEALRENNSEIIATLAADQHYIVPSIDQDKLSAVVQGIVSTTRAEVGSFATQLLIARY